MWVLTAACSTGQNDWFVIASLANQQPDCQQLIMEEILTRFPHLGENILKELDSKSLINCKEVDRTFKNFMKVERKSYLRIIQWYTSCSESLMMKIVKKYGSALMAVSILCEIFGIVIMSIFSQQHLGHYLLIFRKVLNTYCLFRWVHSTTEIEFSTVYLPKKQYFLGR